ncbi:hypothetical protein IEQ34_005110 [Dendrobium chrysotoxum]|uniref:Uncharacterized protein n=1 Tax=Dendrobium chrysotoxum TaxID=161865 RepID=A0AAV7H969_DENCH|nr:hypothetical protein IEQ34_005110 [Dendrobium chrysotoxum]
MHALFTTTYAQHMQDPFYSSLLNSTIFAISLTLFCSAPETPTVPLRALAMTTPPEPTYENIVPSISVSVTCPYSFIFAIVDYEVAIGLHGDVATLALAVRARRPNC